MWTPEKHKNAMEKEVNMATEDEKISSECFEDIENVILVDVTVNIANNNIVRMNKNSVS